MLFMIPFTIYFELTACLNLILQGYLLQDRLYCKVAQDWWGCWRFAQHLVMGMSVQCQYIISVSNNAGWFFVITWWIFFCLLLCWLLIQQSRHFYSEKKLKLLLVGVVSILLTMLVQLNNPEMQVPQFSLSSNLMIHRWSFLSNH